MAEDGILTDILVDAVSRRWTNRQSAEIDAFMAQAKRDAALPLEPKTRGRSKLFKD